MHIIFGEEQYKLLENKYTILELDTMRIGEGGPIAPAYCVLENIPLQDLSILNNLRDLHENLIKQYQKRNWGFCRQAISHLVGRWGGELDTFYATISERITDFEANEPGPEWTHVIDKSIN